MAVSKYYDASLDITEVFAWAQEAICCTAHSAGLVSRVTGGKPHHLQITPVYKVSPDTEPHGKASRKIRILALQDFYHIT